MRYAINNKVEEFENARNPMNCEVIVLEQNSEGKYELMTKGTPT